jgi:hypothetical protein
MKGAAMKGTIALAALLVGAGFALGQDERKTDALRRLETMRITLDFQNAPLEDVAGFLRDATGMNFVIDSELHARLAPEQLKVTFKVKDLQLKSALRLLLSTRDMSAVWREGVIFIQHREKSAAAATTLRVYDVRDLFFKIEDFPGPSMELGQRPGTLITMPDDPPAGVMSEELVTELIQAHTGGGSWDSAHGAGIALTNGLLVVTQTRAVHEEIRRLLDLLRQYK